MKTLNLDFNELGNIFEKGKEVARKEHAGLIESDFEWFSDDYAPTFKIFHGAGNGAVMIHN